MEMCLKNAGINMCQVFHMVEFFKYSSDRIRIYVIENTSVFLFLNQESEIPKVFNIVILIFNKLVFVVHC